MARSKVCHSPLTQSGTRTRDRAGRGYTLCNKFAMKTMLKKRGHGSRRMQCFTMEKWNASREPHPQTHYIKGHTFWGGQRGCGYVYRQRRDEGQWYQHPVVVPHPQWDYIKQHAFGGGRVSSLGARLPPHGLRCNWSPGDSVFAC